MRYLIILLCLLMAGVANANTFGTKLGGPSVGTPAACNDTLKDNVTENTGSFNLAGASDLAYIATKFTAGSGFDLCGVSLYVDSYFVYAGNVTVYIYSSAGTTPDSLLYTLGTVAGNALPTSFDWQLFDADSDSLTSGTDYWIVMYGSDINGTNWVKVGLDANTSGRSVKSSDGSTWTWLSDTSLNYKLWD